MNKAMKKGTALLGAAALCFLAGCSGAPNFTGKALTDGQVGVEYRSSVAAGNADLFYDVDGESHLPRGLVLYDNGQLKGIPRESGSFTFTLVGVDPKDQPYRADFSMEIAPGKLAYQGAALPEGRTGEPYRQDLGTATGIAGITYAVKTGSELPAGLTLSEDGLLSGIPEKAGDVTLTVTASANGCEDVEAEFSFSIAQGVQVEENLGKIVFEKFTLPEGVVGEEYNQSIRMAYGVPDITYSFRFSSGKGLPAGLKADKDLGTIFGTPKDSTDGPITFKVTASAEGYESVTAKVTLNVADSYVVTNRFETEYVDIIPKLTGNGYSDSKTGRGMIQKVPAASNGCILGYMNKPTELTYTIYADKAASAELVLGLGSEVGDFTYDPSMFAISVNGEAVDYGTIDVKQIGSSEADFATKDYHIAPVIQLKEGENKITFNIKQSDKATGTFSAVGCLFDYIELLNADCELGWYARVGNLQ